MKKTKYKRTIFIGDTDESVRICAQEYHSSAQLLNHSNYKEFIVLSLDQDSVVYTSLGDLPKDLNIVYNILCLADQIVYCPPTQWSDNRLLNFTDPGTCTNGLTEILLLLLPKSIQIVNLNPEIPDPMPLTDTRKCKETQLWIAGCSISHGVGVDLTERYGHLLSTELNMPCSFLTRPGSAIDWAADQLLRSDIRKNDLVVWGITNPERITYIHYRSE